MKKRLKNIFVLLLSTAAILNLSGCWDCRELNEVGIVLGVALDRSDTPGEIQMTVQVADSSGEQSNQSSGSKKQSEGGTNYFNTVEYGNDVLSVLQTFTLTISRKLNFPNNMLIIYGEDLAKEGVRESLDFFARYLEPRMNAYIFVAKGSAGEVFDIEPYFENIPATEISLLMQDPIGALEKTVIEASDFTYKLISETTSSIAPIIEVREVKGEKRFYVSGCAVFKDDKLAGELTVDECRGYQWIKGEAALGTIDVDVDGKTANILLSSGKSKVTPEIRDDGTIVFNVKITAKGFLIGQTSPIDFTEPENTKYLEEKISQQVKDDIKTTVSKSQELGADIFGFGEKINKKFHRKWKELKPQWGEIYKTIVVKTEATVKIQESGRITRPQYPEKS